MQVFLRLKLNSFNNLWLEQILLNTSPASEKDETKVHETTQKE